MLMVLKIPAGSLSGMLNPAPELSVMSANEALVIIRPMTTALATVKYRFIPDPLHKIEKHVGFNPVKQDRRKDVKLPDVRYWYPSQGMQIPATAVSEPNRQSQRKLPERLDVGECGLA